MPLLLQNDGTLERDKALKIPEYLEWFLPLFYLKLLLSHCLIEEPYRPEIE